MTNNTNNTRNRQPAPSYSLQGDSNFETAINTANFIIGSVMTGVWGAGRLITVGCESSATLLPKDVAEAIVETATAPGMFSTWDSIRAEDSTDAAAAKLSTVKDNLLGANNDSIQIFTSYLDNKAVFRAIIKSLSSEKYQEATAKIEGLSDDEYDNLIDATNTQLTGLSIKDTAKIKELAAAL